MNEKEHNESENGENCRKRALSFDVENMKTERNFPSTKLFIKISIKRAKYVNYEKITIYS
jgi:hypothetical protein